MAKKGINKKSEVEAKPDQQLQGVAKPKPKDYVSAVSQIMKTWLSRHKKLAVCVLVVVLALTSWVVVLWIRDESELTNDEVVVQVNKTLGLSESNPAILDVVDDQKISQPFLEEARNGDKVLLYYKSGKSVLYRPGGQQIVRQGTFTPPDAKIFIRDATNNQALLDEVKNKLREIGGTKIASQDESANEYDKIIVIDITDRYDSALSEVAKKLNARKSRLPAGESVPDADILVIVAP